MAREDLPAGRVTLLFTDVEAWREGASLELTSALEVAAAQPFAARALLPA
jgi:hypothetical protein